jgi:hypothetical protein
MFFLIRKYNKQINGRNNSDIVECVDVEVVYATAIC